MQCTETLILEVSICFAHENMKKKYVGNWNSLAKLQIGILP